jgi:hypothetical protein
MPALYSLLAQLKVTKFDTILLPSDYYALAKIGRVGTGTAPKASRSRVNGGTGMGPLNRMSRSAAKPSLSSEGLYIARNPPTACAFGNVQTADFT